MRGKKSVITSKNTGKKYFNSWSGDVKFEGEPVIRFTDLATHNHASPSGNAPPWPEINKLTPSNLNCETVLAEFNVHTHGDKKGKCPEGYESEHFVQNEYLQWSRGKVTADQFKNYTTDGAPCICMQSYKKEGGKFKSGKGSKEGSPHHGKTLACNDAIKELTETPSLSEAVDICTEAVVDNDPRTTGTNKDKKESVMECLRAVFMEYLDRAVKEDDPSNSAEAAAEQPIAWEVSPEKGVMWARGE